MKSNGKAALVATRAAVLGLGCVSAFAISLLFAIFCETQVWSFIAFALLMLTLVFTVVAVVAEMIANHYRPTRPRGFDVIVAQDSRAEG